MANPTLEFLIKAKDEASNVIKGVNKTLGTVGDAAKTAAITLGAVGAAAGGIAIAFGTVCVKAAAEAQVQMAQFDTILKNTANTSAETRSKILGLANATVKLGFDDEEAAVSIAKFYQRTKDLTQATNLNNIAMDLARARNLKLEEASRMVSLVLSGNARALKEYGIELDETKKPMDALNELQNKLKGSAEAYAKTFSGQLEIINAQWKNFKETIGATLIEAIMPFVKRLSDWAGTTEVQDKIKEIAAAIGILIEGIIKAIKWFWDFGKEIFNQIKQLESFNALLKNLGEAAKKVSELFKNWTKSENLELLSLTIIEIANNLFKIENGIISFSKKLGDAIAWPISKFIELSGWIERIEMRLKNFGTKAIEGIKGLSSKLFGWIPGFQQGGIMPYTGLAYLHAGEKVIPARENGNSGNTFVFNIGGSIIGEQDFIQKIKKAINRESELKSMGGI